MSVFSQFIKFTGRWERNRLFLIQFLFFVQYASYAQGLCSLEEFFQYESPKLNLTLLLHLSVTKAFVKAMVFLSGMYYDIFK